MEEQEPQQSTDKTEPELLYHYTTQEGLLGIIEKRKIWASHLQYLNDKSEGQIYTGLLLNELNHRADELNQHAKTGFLEPTSQLALLAQLMRDSVDQPGSQIEFADKEVLDYGLSAFSWIRGQDTFVASFSGQGDLLSQWRAYSGETGGYSIGFRRSYLKSVGKHFLENGRGSFYDDSEPLVACRYCNGPEEESLKGDSD